MDNKYKVKKKYLRKNKIYNKHIEIKKRKLYKY